MVFYERNKREGIAHLVVPGARAVRVSALVARVHVDQHARIAIVVRRALAVAATAVAREGDSLAGERAAVQGTFGELDVRGRTGVMAMCAGQNGKGSGEYDCGDAGEHDEEMKNKWREERWRIERLREVEVLGDVGPCYFVVAFIAFRGRRMEEYPRLSVAIVACGIGRRLNSPPKAERTVGREHEGFQVQARCHCGDRCLVL